MTRLVGTLASDVEWISAAPGISSVYSRFQLSSWRVAQVDAAWPDTAKTASTSMEPASLVTNLQPPRPDFSRLPGRETRVTEAMAGRLGTRKLSKAARFIARAVVRIWPPFAAQRPTDGVSEPTAPWSRSSGRSDATPGPVDSLPDGPSAALRASPRLRSIGSKR